MSRFLALVVVLFAVFSTIDASAQIHWDASVEAGAMKRFRSGGPEGVHSPEFGPTAQIAAHLALLPLIHVGGYVENDVSGVRKEGWRDFTAAGLHVKAFVPVFPKNMRGWVFAGFGYAGMFQHGFAGIPSRNGGFFDVPFGIGASYRFRKPFSVFAELGGRVEAASTGDAYAHGNAVDRAGMDLAVGIMVEL